MMIMVSLMSCSRACGSLYMPVLVLFLGVSMYCCLVYCVLPFVYLPTLCSVDIDVTVGVVVCIVVVVDVADTVICDIVVVVLLSTYTVTC